MSTSLEPASNGALSPLVFVDMVFQRFSRRYQDAFVLSGHVFDLPFPTAGSAAGVALFQIYDPGWSSCTKKLGPPSIRVLPEAPFRIGGNACVQRIVRAEDDIYAPVHERRYGGLCDMICSVSFE
jgi:hypothetical protein